MSELVDTHVPLGAFLERASNKPPCINELSQSVPDAIRAIEGWISKATQQAPQCESIDAFSDIVARASGDVGIEAVARSLGISRRHLSRIAGEHLGHSPNASRASVDFNMR